MAIGLDDLYHMSAHIYGERNAERPVSATFAHFVEVCGMLTIHTREKVREDISVETALCKALGWYFPLMAKLGVISVEELVFRKYPYACPYCRLCPHKTKDCKEIVGSKTVDHGALAKVYETNAHRRPTSLDGWQEMFENIYAREPGDKQKGRSVVGLFEEIGELAEAIRVFERHPKYFVGEAAVVFSYIMRLANEHALVEKAAGRTFSFERAFLKRYPGVCVQCGYPECVCPSVPESTVGRLAKELDLGTVALLAPNPVSTERARVVSKKVWDELGEYPEIARQFPFDRGEANRSLVLLCVQIAEAVAAGKPETARQLRDAALTIGREATYAGSRTHSEKIAGLVSSLRSVWPIIEAAVGSVDALGPTPAMIAQLLRDASVQSCRIGIVTALPKEFAAVRAMFESSREFPVRGDPNDYVLGAIPARDGSGTHLVVLTLAKKMGTNSASATATNLLRSFPQVRDVLMVGIAAGAPDIARADRHVRLGDVVVSDKDGLIQYDNVKLEERTIEIRDNSSKPSALLLGRVQILESERIAGKRPWESHLERAQALEGCARPPSDADTLVSVDAEGRTKTATHPEDPTRRAGLPKIYYGRIGSANTLMKNALVRDILRDEGGMRAFEMEGSGIADSTWNHGQHYLLIRGICDYGDMTKADLWQGCAAVAAAAYSRALIEAMVAEAM